ncbi:NAD(P)-binding domain-containing protein [Aestuariimicrobium sp. Y1814]|uniref:NAD(P)-binding domain-containing protein n=1 Tax=Aestuariimicrobium sp. Y1814 TaxID=3418742 RepID=UPI003DA738F0
MPDLDPTRVHDSLVIGAGQAGLSASHHLARLGIEHLVLDANDAPGGAWQHRWDALRMADVHGVADLPGTERPSSGPEERANVAVPAYFGDYEQAHSLPVVRPAAVQRVRRAADDSGDFLVEARVDGRALTLRSRTLVNATGTWTRPFVPHYPGRAGFVGTQLHTHDFPGPEFFDGRRTVVVGGGASAVQFLGLLAPRVGAENLVWATRREPVWIDHDFTPEFGAQVVAEVSERARAGLPTRSVVSYTGLFLREQNRRRPRSGSTTPASPCSAASNAMASAGTSPNPVVRASSRPT